MGNLLLSAWNTVGSVALAILILLVMITVHECGHYLAGRLLGFRIDEFSVGFGPALYKRRSKKTGELFALRLIPLGGYCAFAGEDGADAPPAEAEPQRALVQPAPDGLPAEPSAAAPQPVPAADGERAQAAAKGGRFTEMPPWKRIIVLIAGALMNYILALLLLLACFYGYGQTMVAVWKAEPSADIASEYCLQDLDILLEAEGRKLYLTTDIAAALNGKKQGDLAELLVSRVTGEDCSREEVTVHVMLRADVEVKNSADTDGVWRALGVAYEEDDGSGTWQLANASYRFGFWETLGRCFVYSFKIAGSIFKVIGELLTGQLGLSALGGPVTTITLTSRIAGGSLRGFLEIAGFLGVNLAVFNLLPIPALDGSKVVFTLIEWVRGKPVNRKVEAVIHAVGFLLLLGFAVLVDILQLI